jgi:hypothetical protein
MADETIQALLDPLSTGGAHQDIAEQGTVTPYIVWQHVISPINNTLGGASNIQNSRVQVDCYASSPAARRTLADAVVAAFDVTPLKNVQLSRQNLYESDTKLFRTMLDFSIWS